VFDADGRAVRQAAAVTPGMALDIEFADGSIAAEAKGPRNPTESAKLPGSSPVTSSAKRPNPRKISDSSGGSGNQGSLF
jgi:exodeoxyribonuclease VII large subunit